MPSPYTLIIETATPHASMGLARADGTFENREFHGDRSHNALIFGPLAELLDGKAPTTIALTLVGSGPGSYSGTRVGIAAAQGVAIVADCPAVAVPSILAVPSVTAQPLRECLAFGDARRDSYWTARMNGCEVLTPPAITDRAGLLAQLSSASDASTPIISLEPATRYDLPEPLASHVIVETPTAFGLWQAWLHATQTTRDQWTASPPQPIYLKPPHVTLPKR